MEIIKAAILGIIQGITEWLPISSTGHLLLADEIIHLDVSDAFYSVFLVVIQLGSILAVVILYFSELWPFVKDREKREKSLSLWLKVIVASVPAAIFGFLLDDIIDEKLSSWQVISFALFVYGVLYIILERKVRIKTKIERMEDVKIKDAFFLGLFQTLALIPGTSRSGSTILGGIIMGFSRPLAAKFSFFMALPVMAGASLLRILKSGFSFSSEEYLILFVGTLVSFLVSLVVIKKLVSFVRSHDFAPFGVYRIVLSLLVVAYFSIK